MTTPTQAQIEAAAISLYRAHCIRSDRRFDWEQSVQSMWRDYARAALTAAEVGEQDPNWDAYTAGLKDGIERCAQVADQFDGCRNVGKAIRALKNQLTDPNLQYPGKDTDFVFPEE